MSTHRVIVVGGGAAGFFGAITCAENRPDAEVAVLEKGAHFLSKVRISGGGRCNVTHACFDPQLMTTQYPRGEQELIGAFRRFQASDTVEWFEQRGVKLKIESDGRMFPTTDSSQTIIDCLIREANAAGVKMRTHCPVAKVSKNSAGEFILQLNSGELLTSDRLLLATGGCRTAAGCELAVSLGHTLAEPVPSLFTFHIETPWLRQLAGISVESVEVSVPPTGLWERGPLLVTHWGLSGPSILRLSAWGARALHEFNYKFLLHINWLPGLTAEKIAHEIQGHRQSQPTRRIVNSHFAPLPARLWEQLVLAAGIAPETRWAELGRSARHQLVQLLMRTEFQVIGKSLNKDEFVTCGGVRLEEINFKTMESRVCAGLYVAGELLDIDGITGGFNFQAAWTTGWIAGQAMAVS
jgi:predicted Rossmann fold flavoprotein